VARGPFISPRDYVPPDVLARSVSAVVWWWGQSVMSASGRTRTPRVAQRLRAILLSLRRGWHPFSPSTDAFGRWRQPY